MSLGFIFGYLTPLVLLSGLWWALWRLSWIDLRKLWIPDHFVLGVAALGVLARIWMGLAASGLDPLWEGALGALLFWAVTHGIRFVSDRLAGQEAFGLGDVKLSAGLGIWLGPSALLAYLLLGSLLGIGLGLWIGARRRLKGRKPPRYLPAGPGFAAAGAVLALAVTLGWPGFP